MNGKDAFEAAEIREPSSYRRTAPIEPSDAEVERAAEMLVASSSPMIHAGSGVVHAGAFAGLEAVAGLLQAPVTTSWGGRGALPETSPSAIPMIHIEVNDRVRNDADVVLVLGSRLGETDWWGKAPNWAPPARQRTIQVDVDEEVLGLNKPVELAILADAKTFLEKLALKLEERKDEIDVERRQENLRRYGKELRKSRAEIDKKKKKACEGVNPAEVPGVCQEVFPEDTIWVFDGGNTAVWANFFHEARVARSLLSTFKFGMLGAGLGQALGAQAAHPGRAVCAILGDGAMGFHVQEIETAVRNDLPVVFVVLCDRQWGMVKMNQQFALKPVKTLIKKSLSEEETIHADLGEIAFDEVARAMGAHGERVGRLEELAPALSRSLQAGRAAVVQVDVDRVAHMWAPGLLHFKNMHLEPGG